MTELTPVPGFPGVYVTPGGEVYRQLATSPSDHGYRTVKLGKTTVRHHVLVCLAFHGPPPPGMEVRHLDGDPANVSPGNLAWGTRTQNMADAVAHGTTTRGERNAQAKLTLVQAQLVYDRRTAGEGGSALALEFGISQQAVCDLVAGRTWPEIGRSCRACLDGDHLNCPAHACRCQRRGH